MPSTYTVNLGIEKPATGEQSGTWGDTTNLNFDMLDQAINGAVSITLASAGTSGSPNTLAISDGAVSDGRNKWIEFTDGADLGATAYVQLTPNDAEKIVFIRNSLSGSRSVILFQGTYDAGRDLEVPAGVDMVVKFSGGGATATTTNIFQRLRVENLNIAGTTTVDGVIDDDTMATASATKLATSESIKAYVDTTAAAQNELSEVLANGNTTGGNNILFAENDKAIFGAGSDLQIYHDGANSIIRDAGVGDMRLWVNDFKIYDAAGTTALLTLFDTGATNLGYAGAFKLSTTNTGVDITGTVVSDGLTVNGAGTAQITSTSGTTLELIRSGTAGQISALVFKDGGNAQNRINSSGGALEFEYGASNLNAIKIDNNGDITFFDTLGNASFVYDESAGSVFNEQGDNKDFRVESELNTHMLFVDASAERVSVGTASPSNPFHVYSILSTPTLIETNTTVARIAFKDSGTTDGNSVRLGSAGDALTMLAGNVERLRLSSTEAVFNDSGADTDFRVESDTNTHALFVDAGSSEVGINTSTPGGALDVVTSNNGRFLVDLWGSQKQYYNGNVVAELNWTGTGDSWFKQYTNIAGVNSLYNSISSSGAIFNEDGADRDFRVESSGRSYMFFVDASANAVGVNSSAPSGIFEVFALPSGGATSNLINFIAQDGGNQNSDSPVLHLGASGQTNGARFQAVNIDAYGKKDLVLSMNNGTDYATSAERFRFKYGGGFVTNPSNGGVAVFNESGANADFRVESDNNSSMLFVDASTDKLYVGGITDLSDRMSVVTGGGVFNGLSIGNTTNSSVALGNFTSGDVVSNLITSSSKFGGIVQGGTNGNLVLGVRDNDSSDGLFVISGAADQQTNDYSRLRLSITPNTFVVNETGDDADFRVESDTNTHMLFVDAGANHVNIGGSADYGGTFNVITTQTGNALTVNSTDGSATHGPNIRIFRDSDSPADNDYIGRINFDGKSGSGASITYAQILTQILDVTGGTEDARLKLGGLQGGTFVNYFDAIATETVINEDSVDRDFRVESDSNANMFVVNAGTNSVGIGADPASRGSVLLTEGGSSLFGAELSTDGEAYALSSSSKVVYSPAGTAARVYNRSTSTPGTGALIDFLAYGGTSGTTAQNVFMGAVATTTGSSNTANLVFGRRTGTTAWSEMARFDPNGHFIVGSQDAFTSGGTNSGGNGAIMVARENERCLFLKRAGGNGTVVEFIRGGVTSPVGSVSITTTATSYNTSSDYRLKENVVELTGATERLKQLNPSRFNFIADPETTVDGFLAHEVQAVVPEAIHGTKDEVDAEGNPVYQGIDQSKLVPLLVATIKELEARIAALEAK